MDIKSIFLLYVCLDLTYGNGKTIFEPQPGNYKISQFAFVEGLQSYKEIFSL